MLTSMYAVQKEIHLAFHRETTWQDIQDMKWCQISVAPKE